MALRPRLAARVGLPLALLWLGFSVAVGPARAVAQQGRPVEGGGSFNDAPLLLPGLYSDTIRKGEALFYAIDVAYGQRLRARVTFLRAPEADAAGFLGENVAMEFITPSRGPTLFGGDNGIFSGRSQLTLADTTPRIGSDQYEEPGTYFVTVEMDDDPGPGGNVEYDILLSLEVLGAPLEQPTPSPLPPTTAPPELPDGAAPPETTGGGPSVVRIYLVSFLIGGLGGAVARLWMKARRGA